MKILDNKKFVGLTVVLAVIIVGIWFALQNGTIIGKATANSLNVSVGIEPREVESDGAIPGDEITITLYIKSAVDTSVSLTLTDIVERGRSLYYEVPITPSSGQIPAGGTLTVIGKIPCDDGHVGPNNVKLIIKDVATVEVTSFKCYGSTLANLKTSAITSSLGNYITHGETTLLSATVTLENPADQLINETNLFANMMVGGNIELAKKQLSYSTTSVDLSSSLTCDITSPGNRKVNAGDHEVIAAADPAGVLGESSEQDNTKKQAIRCAVAELVPILGISTDADTVMKIYEGMSAYIFWGAYNVNRLGRAKAFKTELRYGGVTVPMDATLEPMTNKTSMATFTCDSSKIGKEYAITVSVDTGNTVNELTEIIGAPSNNTITEYIRCELEQ